jgi:hypothetical protein
MLKHLFNSQGRPIAYVHEGDKVFLYDGRFLGWLTDGGVWNGVYRGEVLVDRLLYRDGKAADVRPNCEVPFSIAVANRRLPRR